MSGTTDLDNPFVEWLQDELRERQWTRDDLAREAGFQGTSGIGNILTRTKNLGPDMARAIARALDVKQRRLFVIARLIDDEEVDDATQENDYAEIQRLLDGIDGDQRARIRRVIRSIVREVIH